MDFCKRRPLVTESVTNFNSSIVLPTQNFEGQSKPRPHTSHQSQARPLTSQSPISQAKLRPKTSQPESKANQLNTGNESNNQSGGGSNTQSTNDSPLTSLSDMEQAVTDLLIAVQVSQ